MCALGTRVQTCALPISAVLAPLVEREILYRLICSDQGVRLWQIAHRESRLQQINRAIGRLQRDFEKPITVAELAAEAGMSVSAFHQHFRSEEHTSELQSLMRISYAVFCLTKKKNT